MRSAVILKKTFAILFGIIRIHRFNMDMESRVFSNFYERESLRGTFRRDISSRLFSLARDAFLFPLQLRSTIQLSMYGIFGRIAETSRQLRDSNARRCLDAIPIIRVQWHGVHDQCLCISVVQCRPFLPPSPLPPLPPSLSLSHTHTHTHIFILYVITPWAFNFSPFCLRYAEKRRNVFLQESEKHRSAFFARSRTRSPFTRCLGHEGAFSFSFSATTLFCSFDSRVVVVVVRHHLDRRSEAIPEQM